MMKRFGIECVHSMTKKNVWGRVICVRSEYLVYRSLFFGLFRRYLRISPSYTIRHAYGVEFEVVYVDKRDASRLLLEDAEALVRELRSNPDCFVCYRR